MSVRVKKAKQRSRSSRSKNSAHASRSLLFSWAANPRAIVLVVVGVVAVVALIAARPPSHRADIVSVDAQPEANARLEDTSTRTPAAAGLPGLPATGDDRPARARDRTLAVITRDAAMASRLETNKTVVSKAAAASAMYTTNASSLGKTPPVESVKAPAVESTAKTLAVESAPMATATESTPKTDAQNVAPTTITGCLELDEERFRLKDISGGDAPTSRSWRSGFLKKRPSPIELVDATHTLNLPNYVGQRVAATGVLMNRELRARSVQKVTPACD
jgi:hypothetical protein